MRRISPPPCARPHWIQRRLRTQLQVGKQAPLEEVQCRYTPGALKVVHPLKPYPTASRQPGHHALRGWAPALNPKAHWLAGSSSRIAELGLCSKSQSPLQGWAPALNLKAHTTGSLVVPPALQGWAPALNLKAH